MRNKDQYIAVTILSLAAAGLALGLLETESTAFDRFLGPIHPLLAITLATLTALPSLWYLTQKRGFAAIGRNRMRRGLAASAVTASAFAAAVIAVDLGLRYPETINVPFPRSLLFYPAIGLVVELLLHVTLLAALLLLLHPLTRRLGEKRVVWIGIALAALVEPVLQLAWAGSLSWTELYTAFSVFLFGVTQMALFRRYGFLSMAAIRLVYYLLWHIAWGHIRLELLF